MNGESVRFVICDVAKFQNEFKYQGLIGQSKIFKNGSKN